MSLFQEKLQENTNLMTDMCISQVEYVCKREEEKVVEKLCDIVQKDD